MNRAPRNLTTATAGLGGMIMLSLAANANAQCAIQNNRTFVQHGAVAAVPVAPVPVVAVAPTTYAPVESYPAAYRQVITPAPVAVYAPPQVVYTQPVIVAAPVYRSYVGHTRIITYGGHGHHGRQYGHHYYRGHHDYRGHHYPRHGRHGVHVNFGLRIGH